MDTNSDGHGEVHLVLFSCVLLVTCCHFLLEYLGIKSSNQQHGLSVITRLTRYELASALQCSLQEDGLIFLECTSANIRACSKFLS